MNLRFFHSISLSEVQKMLLINEQKQENCVSDSDASLLPANPVSYPLPVCNDASPNETSRY